jgi:short-subunit dehydrogenase
VICPGPVRTKFRLLFDEIAPNAPAFVVLDAAAVSQAIVKAIETERFEVIMPRALAFVCFLKGLMPGFIRFLTAITFRPRAGPR